MKIQKTALFVPGQIVCMKSNNNKWGVVISSIYSEKEFLYSIVISGSIQTLYESQLQNKEVSNANRHLSLNEFHAYLTALQIKFPGATSLYSLNAARISFIPYQFRPVLRFIRSDRPRMLIADSVGVGKTIEAGLILRELQARRDVKSVLIICPRPLVTEKKWQREMRRFEEKFAHLDGTSLRYCINEAYLDGEWPEEYKKCIVPYSLFDESVLFGTSVNGKRKIKKGLLDLDPPPRFDLVIVDEAHHIRNQNTFSHQAVRFFCDHAEAVIFLTATPIQMGNNDLFVLLNTLRPDLIIDKESFSHMAEPNPFINQAVLAMRSSQEDWQQQAWNALDAAVATSWGQAILKRNPEFCRIYDALLQGDMSAEERVQLISDTEKMHTFSSMINRTRRRDIGNFTIRKPETVSIYFTPEQQKLHDCLLDVQAEIFAAIHDDVNIKFMMTTIKRQAASCLPGLIPALEDILNRHLDEIFGDPEDNQTVLNDYLYILLSEKIEKLLDEAKSLDYDDPKIEALYKIICAKQEMPNNKVMVFSCFRHTLAYLYDNLMQRGLRVGLVHGGTPDDERIILRSRFEKQREHTDSLDVLLFSEIGCEGLDYQFCDCLINYDLPWNPMRIEQRIGRIDRNGQKSESVAIINMVTEGTIDAEIYDRCLLRIGIFNSSLGGSEEILGEITKEIKNIAENYELTPEERQEKLQQLADNKIRLIQEEEALEKEQAALFGIQYPKNQINKEICDATNFWLSPESLQRLVMYYLQEKSGKDDVLLGDGKLKTLRLSQDLRKILLKDYQQLTKQNVKNFREWEQWLKGNNPHLSLTFDSECAMHHPEASFVMPLHPLVKQAAYALDTEQVLSTSLTVTSDLFPAGRYPFAIYTWQFCGLREDLVLKPFAEDPELTEKLPLLLQQAEPYVEGDEIGELARGQFDGQHYALWSDAKKAYKQKAHEIVDYRRESLKTSHNARMALLKEQLAQATNDKIRKMRSAQIKNAESDYSQHIQDLDLALQRIDIIASPIAYGELYIRGGNK